MKALKVKRSSLRSFWRRSLVILSLLALVFAVACNNDSAGGGGGGGDDYNGTTPQEKVIVAMRILSHPSLPSYVAFEPNLTGMIVEVTYEDGTMEVITDTAQFITLPPVIPALAVFRDILYDYPTLAATSGPWTSANYPNATSATGNPGVDPIFMILPIKASKVMPVPVRLPFVVPYAHTANTFGHVTAEVPVLTGQANGAADYYEDEGVDTRGLVLEAVYARVPGLAVGTAWSRSNHTEKRQIPIRSIVNYNVARPNRPGGVDVGSWGVPDNEAGNNLVWYNVDGVNFVPYYYRNYYRVERIVYVTGSATLRDYAVDQVLSEINWTNALDAMGARFNVYYYNTTRTKEIGIAEYRRAMQLPEPRATSPQWNWTESYYGTFYDPISVGQDTFYLRLQYYNIEAPPGTTNAEYADYPNQAVIDMTPNILEFNGARIVRKPGTGTYADNQTPQIITPAASTPMDTVEALMYAAFTYYDFYWVYGTSAREVLVRIPQANLLYAAKQAYTADNTIIDMTRPDTIDPREFSFEIETPYSNNRDLTDIEIPFWALP